jgi:hypothetical protein
MGILEKMMCTSFSLDWFKYSTSWCYQILICHFCVKFEKKLDTEDGMIVHMMDLVDDFTL